ncbi:iron complex transport system permease protein [Quadrisphaera granulorum]|uniref:Iron complex transport system permease protein n=2 Tax=Quadrisphaera granulorum TaxID=317664 RepID=A0A316AFU5_9ACTN|nr:iron complex transport system permease protein [Quadrisphaera granulorum]SZE95125.1 iron complex transport system permease protein [Quadrisphaera granulorum]
MVALLAALLVAVVVVSMCVGERTYSPLEVARVLAGEPVPGASFTVTELRLPRTVMGLVVGVAFGLGGVVFQTMLRNALASPDIIGVSVGASAVAVIAITAFGFSGLALSGASVLGGVFVALVIYALAWRRGVHGARLVLVGIAIGAMFQSVISYALTRTSVNEASEALRWLTGSLNSASNDELPPLLVAAAVLVPLVVAASSRLSALQLGDDTAAALGVKPNTARLLLLVLAVALVSVATAASGPIAFVAFLAGPIAHRLVRGTGSLLLPAALVGALLVLVGDLIGQYALPTRFPVGVITGVLGAPYLLWLLARTNRSGGGL